MNFFNIKSITLLTFGLFFSYQPVLPQFIIRQIGETGLIDKETKFGNLQGETFCAAAAAKLIQYYNGCYKERERIESIGQEPGNLFVSVTLVPDGDHKFCYLSVHSYDEEVSIQTEDGPVRKILRDILQNKAERAIFISLPLFNRPEEGPVSIAHLHSLENGGEKSTCPVMSMTWDLGNLSPRLNEVMVDYQPSDKELKAIMAKLPKAARGKVSPKEILDRSRDKLKQGLYMMAGFIEGNIVTQKRSSRPESFVYDRKAILRLLQDADKLTEALKSSLYKEAENKSDSVFVIFPYKDDFGDVQITYKKLDIDTKRIEEKALLENIIKLSKGGKTLWQTIDGVFIVIQIKKLGESGPVKIEASVGAQYQSEFIAINPETGEADHQETNPTSEDDKITDIVVPYFFDRNIPERAYGIELPHINLSIIELLTQLTKDQSCKAVLKQSEREEMAARAVITGEWLSGLRNMKKELSKPVITRPRTEIQAPVAPVINFSGLMLEEVTTRRILEGEVLNENADLDHKFCKSLEQAKAKEAERVRAEIVKYLEEARLESIAILKKIDYFQQFIDVGSSYSRAIAAIRKECSELIALVDKKKKKPSQLVLEECKRLQEQMMVLNPEKLISELEIIEIKNTQTAARRSIENEEKAERLFIATDFHVGLKSQPEDRRSSSLGSSDQIVQSPGYTASSHSGLEEAPQIRSGRCAQRFELDDIHARSSSFPSTARGTKACNANHRYEQELTHVCIELSEEKWLEFFRVISEQSLIDKSFKFMESQGISADQLRDWKEMVLKDEEYVLKVPVANMMAFAIKLKNKSTMENVYLVKYDHQRISKNPRLIDFCSKYGRPNYTPWTIASIKELS